MSFQKETGSLIFDICIEICVQAKQGLPRLFPECRTQVSFQKQNARTRLAALVTISFPQVRLSSETGTEQGSPEEQSPGRMGMSARAISSIFSWENEGFRPRQGMVLMACLGYHVECFQGGWALS